MHPIDRTCLSIFLRKLIIFLEYSFKTSIFAHRERRVDSLSRSLLWTNIINDENVWTVNTRSKDIEAWRNLITLRVEVLEKSGTIS